MKRIDALFDIEREINGLSPARRHVVRQERSVPLVTELERWMIATRQALARTRSDQGLQPHAAPLVILHPVLDDGRICLPNNAAERALRGVALGRKSWLFCGSDRGGQRAAVLYSAIVSAKLNDIDPQAWLADILARIAAHPAQRIDDLLPWNWRSAEQRTQPVAA